MRRTVREPEERRTAAFKRLLGSFDWAQWFSASMLLAVGVLFIHSTGAAVAEAGELGTFAARQLCWIGAGLALYFFLAFTDYRKYLAWTAVFYLLTILLLVYVLGFGILVYGARRWIDFGGFRLQPSEPAKLTLILFLSALCSLPSFSTARFGSPATAAGLTLVPFLLVACEPDLGSALIFPPIAAVILFGAGLRMRTIVFAGAVLCVIASLLAANEMLHIRPLLKEYQKERIRTFFNPGRGRLKTGYNQYQARLAVGSGGLTGKGLGRGTQHVLGFLPRTVVNNDFIFSVIAEESGFLGALGVLMLYAWLLWSILRCAWIAVDDFGRNICLGVAAMIFFHAFVNIGMNIGLAPVTGLPLPLVSYGGSFILIALASLGMVQSVHRIARLGAR